MKQVHSEASLNQINEELMQAVNKCDLDKIKELISSGADANYVKQTGADCWYKGDTHTPLSQAFDYKFQEGEEEKYIQMLQYLLINGADPKYQLVKGSWSKSRNQSIFNNLASKIHKFSTEALKIRFMEVLVKYGVNINRSRQRGTRGSSICFIFQMMDGCGLPSRIQELRNMYKQVDFSQLQRQREQKLQIKFNKQYGLQTELETNKVQNNQPTQELETNKVQNNQPTQQNKPPQISLIKQLLNMGVDVNTSFKKSTNIQLQKFEKQIMIQMYKLLNTHQFHRQTLLHRLIMNNATELVKLVLQKGADKTDIQFTIDYSIYPQDWPQFLLTLKLNQNKNSLRYYEQKKSHLESLLQKSTSPQETAKLKQRILDYQFDIFKAQRYYIQSQIPLKANKKISISCLELAEKFQIDQQIIELLKQSV